MVAIGAVIAMTQTTPSNGHAAASGDRIVIAGFWIILAVFAVLDIWESAFLCFGAPA